MAQTKEAQAQLDEQIVQIGTLFKFIKAFDGTREKLNAFLTNCDNAMDLAIDSQKPILFKFIISQLGGKAETACSIKEFDSWEQLKTFLKTQFGERKHYAHLLTDLQECRQLNNEPVNQFVLRVETCLSKLLTEVTLSNRKKSELAGRLVTMEDLALNSFLLGLRPEISNLVRCKNPSNLNEAINLAISEEKILVLFNKRNSHNSTVHRPSFKPQYHPKPSTSNANSNFQMSRQFDHKSQIPFCRYCKIHGHTIEVCRKREFNNNRFKGPQTFQNIRQGNTKPVHINCVVDDDVVYDLQNQPPSNVTEFQQYNDEGNLNE